VESCLRASDVVNSTIAIVGNTSGEVVGLHVSGDTSKPLPINLVKIVRLQDERGNNSSARCCFKNCGYSSEKDII
jgi:hypothetical protein